MSKPPVELTGTAYSYIRFSSKEQERGDSLRRQTDLRDAWLKRHPCVQFDTSLTLRDLGVSAYRGRHRESDKYALGEFVRLVEAGRVARGSLLIIENLDRLSREEEEDAVHLFLGIIRAGVVIVQLEPETVFRKGDGMLGIIRAVIELSRAHAESERKSVRVAEAWGERKKAAAAGGAIITRRCPAWLEVVNGKFKFKPGAKDTVRRIFALSLQGRGSKMIAADLNAAGVAHFVLGNKWDEMYVRKILTSRAVLGEHQPMRGTRKERVPDGPPIAGYYPAAVDEKTWFAAAASIEKRKNRGGRRGDNGWVNVFADKLHDVRTGERLQAVGRIDRRPATAKRPESVRRYRVLLPGGVKRWAAKCIAFPLDTFEEHVLGELREIDPREFLPDATEEGGRVADLVAQVAELDGRISRIQAALTDGGGEVESVVSALRDLEAKRKRVAADLVAARRSVASPLQETWGTLKGLAGLAAQGSDTRIRIRSAVAKTIKRIDCLFVPNGEARFAAVQVAFADTDARRHYLILHRPGRPMRGGMRAAGGRVVTGLLPPAGFDLTAKADAAAVEQLLGSLDLSKLDAGMKAEGKGRKREARGGKNRPG